MGLGFQHSAEGWAPRPKAEETFGDFDMTKDQTFTWMFDQAVCTPDLMAGAEVLNELMELDPELFEAELQRRRNANFGEIV